MEDIGEAVYDDEVVVQVFYKCRFCKKIFPDTRTFSMRITGELEELVFQDDIALLGRRGHMCDKGILHSPDAIIHGVCEPYYVQIVSSGRVWRLYPDA